MPGPYMGGLAVFVSNNDKDGRSRAPPLRGFGTLRGSMRIRPPGGINLSPTAKGRGCPSPFCLLFMVHTVVFFVGGFAGQVHAEFF